VHIGTGASGALQPDEVYDAQHENCSNMPGHSLGTVPSVHDSSLPQYAWTHLFDAMSSLLQADVAFITSQARRMLST
jgi:hypothetical protein